MAVWASSLEVVVAGLNGAPGVSVRGEIDADSVPALELALDAAIYGSVGAFVLDLSDVTFLDSSGLRLLLRARALLGRKDRALAVVCPHGAVRRVLELAGIADLLFLFASREEAAAVLRRPAQAALADRDSTAAGAGVGSASSRAASR